MVSINDPDGIVKKLPGIGTQLNYYSDNEFTKDNSDWFKKNIEKYGSKQTYIKAYTRDWDGRINLLKKWGVKISPKKLKLIDIKQHIEESEEESEEGDLPYLKFSIVISDVCRGAIVIGDKTKLNQYDYDYKCFKLFDFERYQFLKFNKYKTWTKSFGYLIVNGTDFPENFGFIAKLNNNPTNDYIISNILIGLKYTILKGYLFVRGDDYKTYFKLDKKNIKIH